MTRRALAGALAGILLLSGAPARAGFTTDDIGTSGAQFLKLGAGARGAGLGEAYTAVVDESDAIAWNPAALARVEHRSATFMHASLPAGINYEFLGYGQKLGPALGVGAGLQYVSQPGIDETDASGFGTGRTFSPSDLAASLGAAYTVHNENAGILDGASFGVVGKYVRSTITRTVYTYAADLGFVSAPFPVFDRDFRVAYVAQNLGGTLKFQETADALPVNLRLGTSWAVSKGWLLALDVNEPVDNRAYLAFGSEYRVSVGEDSSVSARAGLNTRAFGDAGSLSGVSFGLGARLKDYGLDYTIAPMGVLGLNHLISLSVSF